MRCRSTKTFNIL